MFLCRDNELSKMDYRYQSDKLECIVIYGRRRVGKTALINEFCKDKKTIYFPALNAGAQENLEALSRAIQSFLNPNLLAAATYNSFDEAFGAISGAVKDERVIFVIDEFPYLAKSDPSIPSRLQHLLDHEWADSKLYLILCGSSMRYMEKEVLSARSPLFGRRSAQFHIQPLSYLDSAKFCTELSPEENALIYGITGGIPHYINKLDVTSDIRSSLIRNFFDTSSYLFEEPENLLKQELREPAKYNSIIACIAGGRTRLNEIASVTRIESSVCNKYIRTLEALGIVTRTEPVVGKNKRKTLYRISDNLFRFWYRFVPRNMQIISRDLMDRSYDALVGSYLSEYMGAVFEDICRQYLYLHMDSLPFPLSEVGEWWGNDPKEHKEVQLDIVATGIKAGNTSTGNQYIIGSCKYTNKPVDVDELALIRSYASIFADARDHCYYYIFSKGGFTDALRKCADNDEVTLITLEELYRADT